jgi:hypothetical protein
MNRTDSLLFLKSRFDALMLGVERTVDDTQTGYQPTLDESFSRYIDINGLTTNVMETVVSGEDSYGFGVLLSATTYDLLIPLYAMTPDMSVDAPLTNVKFSQTFRALQDLRMEAWEEAAQYGYIGPKINAGGFVLQLTHNEPGNADTWREFG